MVSSSMFTPEQLAKMHRSDSRVHEILWAYSVPIVASIISTVLRLYSKRLGRNGIAPDDYFIILATMCLTGECAVGLILGPSNGMGRHVIYVSEHSQMMIRKGDYIFSHFYDIALVSVKLAILAFYWRVFVHPVFRYFVLATAAFVAAWGIGITVTLGLVCRPLESYWNSNVVGECLTIVTFTYFTNVSNLITDIWIFLMPVPMIWHLQLQTKKKLMLTVIFCIGLATCVVSALRLTVVLGHGSPNFTWYYVPLGMYSVFEPLGGILCSNLPIIWHMMRKRKAMLPCTKPNSSSHTPTIGSGSLRSRVARSLGLTSLDSTQSASCNMTTVDHPGQGEAGWRQTTSMENDRKPDPNVWTTIERLNTGNALSEAESSAEPLKPGMKKTVWNVRK